MRGCRIRTRTSPCRPTGRSRTPTTTCASSRPPSRRSIREAAVDPRGRHRHRHRLHGVHDAARRGRRHGPRAAARASARTRMPGSSSGSTTPRSPQADRINAVARDDRAGLARPLRRQDLVRVVLREGPPDPRRGAGGLRRRGPAHRGRRLGRLAADRRRDPERVHGRLQGDVVEARRLPGPATFFGALDPRFADVVDDKMRARPAAGRRAGRRALAGGGGLDRAAARDRGRGRRTSMPTSRSRRPRSPSPAGWS